LIDINPQNIALIWERGANKIGVGDFKSGQLDFYNCLGMDSTYIPAMFFLAWSYHINGDSNKAIELYENILNQNLELGSMGDITKIYVATLKRKIREEK
jgi:hypothetical protein